MVRVIVNNVAVLRSNPVSDLVVQHFAQAKELHKLVTLGAPDLSYAVRIRSEASPYVVSIYVFLDQVSRQLQTIPIALFGHLRHTSVRAQWI